MPTQMKAASSATAWLLAIVLGAGALATSAQEPDLDDQLFQAVDTFSSSQGEVAALVEQGADPNAKADNGATPLMVAAIRGNETAVPELLAAGARVDEATEGGTTALMLAAREDEDDVASLLLEAGAKGDAVDDDGWTALMYAAQNNAWQTIDLFVEKGFDLNQKTPDGWDALLIAAEQGRSSIVDRLLKAGAELPAMSPGGIPTLVRAAAAGDSDVLLRVIEYQPDLEVRGPGGETALIAAAAAGRTEVLMELLRRGANAAAEDSEGRTALALAEEREDREMAALLGADWEPRRPAANAMTISLTCETLGGEVQLALEPQGDQMALAVYYPKPVSAYLGGAELCPIDPAKRKECGFKRFSADATFYFDVDNRRKTGHEVEYGDPEEAAGSESGVSVSEVRTSVRGEDGRMVSRQVMLTQVLRNGESLSYEETDGHFQSAVRDLNRLALSGSMSVLEIQPDQEFRLVGEIDLCGAGERVVALD